MSTSEKKTWLVCYDIREPKRLRRVHRELRKVGATVQYSAFSVRASDAGIHDILERTVRLIDDRVDDLRAYYIPERCQVWTLGVQHLPAGVTLDAQGATSALVCNFTASNEHTDAMEQGDDLSFL